jgi:hypothetical protein
VQNVCAIAVTGGDISCSDHRATFPFSTDLPRYAATTAGLCSSSSGGAISDKFATIQHHTAGTEIADKEHVMFNDEQAHTPFVEFLQNADYLVADFGMDARRGLIQTQEPGLPAQGCGHRQQFLLATRQRAGRLVGDMGPSKLMQQPFDLIIGVERLEHVAGPTVARR